MHLFSGTKETAYVYAITSAGVVYSVTRACSSGHIPDCKCDTSSSGKVDKSGKWKWAECNDNVYYGIKFAKQFIDAAENEFPQRIRKNKRKNMRKLMNLHNNKVGRTVRPFLFSLFVRALCYIVLSTRCLKKTQLSNFLSISIEDIFT